MIWHRIDLNHCLLFIGDNAGNILVQCFLVLLGNEGGPAFDCNDNAYVKLGIGICHNIVLWRTCSPTTPTGLGCWSVCYVSCLLSFGASWHLCSMVSYVLRITAYSSSAPEGRQVYRK